jgi:SAM-dependent methyltransferase
MSERDVAAKLAHRGRGLVKLERHVGPVCREVEKRLTDARKKIRLLEIGCGFGVALMELRRRFSERIELTGTNKEKPHGDTEAMLMAASLCNVNDVSEAQTTALPTIMYCDMANGLPFDDCSFDVVVSQMCIQYVDDKILFLREAARVLKDNGIAMIHTPLNSSEIPAPYDVALEIWDQGTPLTFSDYLAACKGQTGVRFGYHSCVHLSHCNDFGADLELIFAIRLNQVFSTWDGVKSTYRRKH